MTFTSRIRTYLLLTATVPPLILMAVIYYHGIGEMNRSDRVTAVENLRRLEMFNHTYLVSLNGLVEKAAESDAVRRASLRVRSGDTRRADLSAPLTGLDFWELTDSNMTVLASHHRPGLVGQHVQPNIDLLQANSRGFFETIEYDLSGAHTAFATLMPLEGGISLYTGAYLDTAYYGLVSELINAETRLVMADEAAPVYTGMNRKKVYDIDGELTGLIAGGDRSGFYLIAGFRPSGERPLFTSILRITGLVALAAVLVAILLGWYITGQAKKEVENLLSATARVAEGDFSTPVMAYEEGEFSQLADSFSEMMLRLRNVRQKLAVSEKIAAWQVMGRKVAHEIKNPLTPIAISADDLRRSYHERQPDFEQILLQTTSTITAEVRRLTQLLDQFVGFARMKPPAITESSIDKLLKDVTALYRREVDSERLILTNNSRRNQYRLDPDQIKQLLVNLIKNSLEAGEDVSVSVTIEDAPHGLRLLIEDNGPGFADEILDNRFEPYLSRKEKGSGLGLVISQRIVHDHGGTIELLNRPEGGAGVLILLPDNNG